MISTVDRKGVKSLGEDIRFISSKLPEFTSEGKAFLVAKPLFWILAAAILLLGLATWLVLRAVGIRRSDVVGTRNRRATKMALGRLRTANDFLSKNLHTAFYEELHKALLGFISDKFNLKVEDLNHDTIKDRLIAEGVGESLAGDFISLLDETEFARYSPESGQEGMKAHYDTAVKVISQIASSVKSKSGSALVAGILIGAGLLAGASPEAMAQQSYVDSLWNKGVEAYSAAQWEEAISAWEGITQAGLESPVLYYNKGNAYFKDENYPMAILCYERALKMDPSSSDARYNLEFAYSNTQDRIDTVPEFFLRTWMRKLSFTFSSNAWAGMSLGLLLLTVVLVLLFAMGGTPGRRKTGFFGGILALLLCILAYCMSVSQKNDYERRDYAIVMKAVSSAKSSPSEDNSVDLFVLHEGTKVEIIDEVGDWRNISLSDGRQGWMKKGDMEVI